jgi:hypothetical protein
LLQGYSESIADARAISEPSSGIGKRAVFWPGVRPLQVNFNMTKGQWAELVSFWETDLNFGTGIFILIDHTKGGSMTVEGDPLTIEGSPVTESYPILVQFAKDNAPRITEAHTHELFRVEFGLEVLP